MPQSPKPTVAFDVLLRARQAEGAPSVQEIARFRPDPGDIERCRRWFSRHGVTAYASGFGLACTSTPEVFEGLFDVRLAAWQPEPNQPSFDLIGEIRPPDELKELIEQVTLTVSPQLF